MLLKTNVGLSFEFALPLFSQALSLRLLRAP